jgi:hypothetical protein
MKRNDANPTCWKAGLLGGILLALSPALAAAQVMAPVPLEMQQPQPYATAVLYEVEESIECNPGGGADPRQDPFCLQETGKGFGTRIADALLKGGVDGFPGGVSGPPEFSGPITVEATSILSQRDWTGPAHGKIRVAAPKGAVIANMAGQLDLSLAYFQKIPIAPINGKWHGIKGFGVGGAFTGVFEIPFECKLNPACPTDHMACYLEDGQCVVAEIPLVKLVVTFYNK